jgi:hypothetical protein
MPINRFGPKDFPIGFATPAQYWWFLGKSSLAANAVTIPGISFGVFRYLYVMVFIAGYSGAGIARIRVGPGTAVDAGLNCGSSLLEGATLNATALSIPGWPLGVATTTGPRFADALIYNEPTKPKRMMGHSNSISTAANTAPTMTQRAGVYSVATAAIQSIDVANYDSLIATAVSANTLLAGSYFSVWGRNDD